MNIEQTIAAIRRNRESGLGAEIAWVDALIAQLEKANEVIRVIADPDVFPLYPSQGMGCGLEDRDITDRYEAMRFGWDSLADRVYDEVIIVAEEYLTALAGAEGER